MAGWRQRIARLIAGPVKRGVRMYGGARTSTGQIGFGGTAGSADAELSSSLERLRARSRAMVRDSSYAKRAKMVVVNNVIGTGVGMQAQVKNTRGGLATAVNDSIEWAWHYWSGAQSCHTGGAMAFADLERALMGEVFEAGEVLVRLHRQRFGGSDVPLALEMIEAERLADSIDTYGVAPGNELRMGVEVDSFGRAVAYWVRGRHRGDIHVRIGEQSDRVERVPADEILHLKLTARWPQTRGEPWLHTVVRKLHDMDQYTAAEVMAARASAYYFATVEKPDDGAPAFNDGTTDTGQPVLDIEPLAVRELAPGEQLKFHQPNRPNSSLDPFLRYMLREVAAGVGVSYESLSRDYSQSNYSSSRLALLDDRDGYKALQQWWLRSFRMPLHRIWLQQAVLSRAVQAIPLDAYGADPRRYEAVGFNPRGWSWVDPTKEVNAYKEAIRAGLTTVTDVIAQTAGGLDIEDVIETRKRELEMFAAAGIEVDTTFKEPPAPVVAAPSEPQGKDDEGDEDDDEDDTKAARVLPMRKNG